MIYAVPYGIPLLEVYNRGTAGSGAVFALPADAAELVLIPLHEGTVTLLTLDLEITPDGNADTPVWQKISIGEALASVPGIIDVRGFGGMQCRLTSTGFTLGTALAAVVGAKCSKGH